MKVADIEFPKFSGIRCLMMPYIQGDPVSVPEAYRRGYESIIEAVVANRGEIGYLTIDESFAAKGAPHRGARAKHGRALHTEAGLPKGVPAWGSGWGGRVNVILDRDVQVLIANNIDDSCAVWEGEHMETTDDGDIGHLADLYPYESATMMKAGEVHRIGIFTPHESMPMKADAERQFIRVVAGGVYGREPYFTENPLCPTPKGPP